MSELDKVIRDELSEFLLVSNSTKLS